MTKQDIKGELMNLREMCKGKAKNAARNSEGPDDYYFGQYQAYDELYNKICALEDKIC